MKAKYIIPVLLAGALAVSCQDMMEPDSTTYDFDEAGNLTNARDSLYSAMGIQSQIQKLGERYVLLGELRGDLVTLTSDAPFSMQEVSQFDVTADNEYLSARDYYSVINNCNYALARMDTSIVIHNGKVMLPEYAAIRSMRAWTYLQMGLAFGSVSYITSPILSLEESLADYPSAGLDDLVKRLIDDLAPYATIETPNYGNVDGFDSRRFFVQPRLLLADLCLYDGQYERAAQYYYDYIERNSLNITYERGNRWNSSSQDQASAYNLHAYQDEALSLIPYSSNAAEIHPNLINLTYNTRPCILPAPWFVDEMTSASHFHADNVNLNTITGFLQGDLRGMLVYRDGNTQQPSLFGNIATGLNSTERLITKFYLNGSENSTIQNPGNPMFDDATPLVCRAVVTCRTPHVYLRYAEAANRAGKPSLAFAVLKNGLRREVMTDSVTIAPGELADQKPWTNFAVLDLENWGTAMRGRGLGVRLEGSGFDIPRLETKNDSIEYVESEILREMAAETAFEGNRFFDLLRVSRHRADHPALFAQKVARRFADPQAAEQRLMNPDNWWIRQ